MNKKQHFPVKQDILSELNSALTVRAEQIRNRIATEKETEKNDIASLGDDIEEDLDTTYPIVGGQKRLLTIYSY